METILEQLIGSVADRKDLSSYRSLLEGIRDRDFGKFDADYDISAYFPVLTGIILKMKGWHEDAALRAMMGHLIARKLLDVYESNEFLNVPVEGWKRKYSEAFVDEDVERYGENIHKLVAKAKKLRKDKEKMEKKLKGAETETSRLKYEQELATIARELSDIEERIGLATKKRKLMETPEVEDEEMESITGRIDIDRLRRASKSFFIKEMADVAFLILESLSLTELFKLRGVSRELKYVIEEYLKAQRFTSDEIDRFFRYNPLEDAAVLFLNSQKGIEYGQVQYLINRSIQYAIEKDYGNLAYSIVRNFSIDPTHEFITNKIVSKKYNFENVASMLIRAIDEFAIKMGKRASELTRNFMDSIREVLIIYNFETTCKHIHDRIIMRGLSRFETDHHYCNPNI